MQVVRIEDFSLEQIISAADFRSNFDVALVFSTKYEPEHPMLERWQEWTAMKRRFFVYERDLPPGAAARILCGHIVFTGISLQRHDLGVRVQRNRLALFDPANQITRHRVRQPPGSNQHVNMFCSLRKKYGRLSRRISSSHNDHLFVPAQLRLNKSRSVIHPVSFKLR